MNTYLSSDETNEYRAFGSNRHKPCPRCGKLKHARGPGFMLLKGERVKARLIELDASMRGLSEVIGETTQRISQALRRQVHVHPCVVEKLAVSLQLPAEEIAE